MMLSTRLNSCTSHQIELVRSGREVNYGYFQPPLAYGELGRKPDIPPNSRITYLFGLLHFEKQKEMAEMTWAQVAHRYSIFICSLDVEI